jgi:hypothetical protein
MAAETITRPVLSTADIRRETGWTLNRIRTLIASGKLPAVNVSSGNERPMYAIRREDWLAFIQPSEVPKPSAVVTPAVKTERKRINANVPKRF